MITSLTILYMHLRGEAQVPRAVWLALVADGLLNLPRAVDLAMALL